VLVGLGTIGVGSAGAGFGTTASFSDEETDGGNRPQAGEFDLKVDWQHRSCGPEESDVCWSHGRPYVDAYPDAHRNDPDDPDALSLDTSGIFDQYVEERDGVQDPICSRDEIAAGFDGQLDAIEIRLRGGASVRFDLEA
jgi:predicted ribosomally synthesized peptide with SipW-like signal peptide